MEFIKILMTLKFAETEIKVLVFTLVTFLTDRHLEKV